jgi:hypothetical protein
MGGDAVATAWVVVAVGRGLGGWEKMGKVKGNWSDWWAGQGPGDCGL